MRRVIIIVLFLLSVTQFAYPDQAAGQEGSHKITYSQRRRLVVSCNRFGFKLFRRIAASENANTNIIISPVSAMYSLGMVYNAAAGETREAIAGVLEADGLSEKEINEVFQSLNEILIRADSAVNFRTARSVWFRLGKPIRPGFLDICRTYFDAHTQEIDFGAPSAADAINDWVNRATNGKIATMASYPFNGNPAMILLDATYFEAAWTFPFDSAKTRPGSFRRSDGTQTECRMMFLNEDKHVVMSDSHYLMNDPDVTYCENNLFQAASLPYGGRRFRMTVLVPDSTLTADSLKNVLTPENWASWRAGFHPTRFGIGLPKFRLRFEKDLRTTLESFGLGIAFDPNRCDLSNAFADGIGWVDDVRQKSFIRVDEKGTEVVSVTRYIFADSITPYVLADRPFLFVIDDVMTGLILFIGRIADPVWAG